MDNGLPNAGPKRVTEYPPDLLRRMYLQMQRARQFELRVNQMFLEGALPGTLHLYEGQEACAVGVCENLSDEDWITSTHRPHGHAIAKGVSLDAMMAELFARTTGCVGGYGGSMHVGDPAVGALPAIAIVGGNAPIAAGMALALKMRKLRHVVCCFHGDGAVNEGAYHEGVNMAAIWDLPVVFICENNQYGASTPVAQVTRLERLANRARGYGIPGITIDGMDVLAVYEAVGMAVARARRGEGPMIVECETYRYCGHSRSDTRGYRAREEEARWRERDPILNLGRRLVEAGLFTDQDLADWDQSVQDELDRAVQFAMASPEPDPRDCLSHVHVEQGW